MNYRDGVGEVFADNVSAQNAVAAKNGKDKPKYTGEHATMPIKEMRMVRKWFEVAKEHDASRKRGGVSWYLLVLLGLNTGLRIGDLCKLRVRDVRGRDHLKVKAEKTDKYTDIKIRPEVQKTLETLLHGMEDEDYIFRSRQIGNRTGKRGTLSRQRAFAIIKEIAKRSGMNLDDDNVGCHTLRKTFAWQYYDTCGDLVELSHILNHSSPAITMHYIGLDRKQHDDTIMHMPLMM